jgi:MOSC domain-containing protein YiiM
VTTDPAPTAPGVVEAVSLSPRHGFSKQNAFEVRLVAGLGIEGDAHAGPTVQHVFDRRRDPVRPNLRQVHLIHAELLDGLAVQGFDVKPGDLGENLTTRGVALLDLPTGTRLHVGDEVVLELTGLRKPCVQIERFRTGLLKAVVDRDESGAVVQKAGVMSVVLTGGVVRPDDVVTVELPALPHEPLHVV